MKSMESIIFLLSSLGGAVVLTWLTIKAAKLKDMEETISSDKRTQTQYELRVAKRKASAVISLLIGVLLGLLIVLALNKPNQRVFKPHIYESPDSIIE